MILVVEKLGINTTWTLVKLYDNKRKNKNKLLLERLDNILNEKTSKIRVYFLKQLASILLNDKNKYEVVIDQYF